MEHLVAEVVLLVEETVGSEGKRLVVLEDVVEVFVLAAVVGDLVADWVVVVVEWAAVDGENLVFAGKVGKRLNPGLTFRILRCRLYHNSFVPLVGI